MKKMGRAALLGSVAAVALTMSGSAEAALVINGSVWLTTNANAENATQAEIASLGTASATFTVDQIEFSSFGNAGNTGSPTADYTLSSWLNSLGSLTSSGTITSGQGATAMSTGTPATTGMLFDFTGTASFTNGQTFTVAHDDGVTFLVNGVTVLSSAGPHSPITQMFTYTGATGNFAFDFAYGEADGPPAVLQTTLIPPVVVPEPASIALLGSALAGLGLIRRRRRKL